MKKKEIAEWLKEMRQRYSEHRLDGRLWFQQSGIEAQLEAVGEFVNGCIASLEVDKELADDTQPGQ